MANDAQLTDDAQVASIVRRFEEPLTRYAARLLGDAELARDVVQETFLRLCREAEPARLDGHLGQWLFTVCRNQAIDIKRKENRMSPASAVLGESVEMAVESQESREPDGPANAEQRETAEQLLKLIATLPDNQQEVTRLKFEHGFSYKKIAEITGHSVSNVGYLLHTAIQKLRVELKRSGEVK